MPQHGYSAGGDGQGISSALLFGNLPKGTAMRRSALALISAVAGVMLTAATALANSPHFMWRHEDFAINLAVG
jgi:integral membrane sensor domain MASE1